MSRVARSVLYQHLPGLLPLGDLQRAHGQRIDPLPITPFRHTLEAPVGNPRAERENHEKSRGDDREERTAGDVFRAAVGAVLRDGTAYALGVRRRERFRLHRLELGIGGNDSHDHAARRRGSPSRGCRGRPRCPSDRWPRPGPPPESGRRSPPRGSRRGRTTCRGARTARFHLRRPAQWQSWLPAAGPPRCRHPAPGRVPASARTPRMPPSCEAHPLGANVGIVAIMNRKRVYASIAALLVVATAFGAWAWQRLRLCAVTPARIRRLATCAACHAAEHAAWRLPARAGHAGGHGADGARPLRRCRVHRRRGHLPLLSAATADSSSHTDGPDGKLADFEVKYTFGVYPLQQYLVPFPGGRLQALGIAWDARAAGRRRPALVSPVPGPGAQGGRPAALDRHRPELELPVRGLPLDQPAQELRRGHRHVRTPPGRRSASAARPATGRRRTMWPGRRRRTAARSRRDQGSRRSHSTSGSGITWVIRDARHADRHALGAARRLHARSTPARAATRGAASTPTTIHAGDNWLDAFRPGAAGARALLRRTASSATRSTPGARSCRAGCTPRASPAPTATTRTRRSCARPATACARSATRRRSSTAALIITMKPGRRAPSAPPATCRRRPTWSVDPRHDHSLRIPRPDRSVHHWARPTPATTCHADRDAAVGRRRRGALVPAAQAGLPGICRSLRRRGPRRAGRGRAHLLTLINDPMQPALVRASAIARAGRLSLAARGRGSDGSARGSRRAGAGRRRGGLGRRRCRPAGGASSPPCSTTPCAWCAWPPRAALAGEPEGRLLGDERGRFRDRAG